MQPNKEHTNVHVTLFLLLKNKSYENHVLNGTFLIIADRPYFSHNIRRVANVKDKFTHCFIKSSIIKQNTNCF